MSPQVVLDEPDHRWPDAAGSRLPSDEDGGLRRIRTSDRSVRSRVLYPAALPARRSSELSQITAGLTLPDRACHPTKMADSGGFEPPTARFVAEYSIQLSYESANGGEGGIRTPDTLLRCTPLAGERLRPLGHLSATRGA